MIHKEIEKKHFIERVIEAGRVYGWEGDYMEVQEFLKWLIEEAGYDPSNYDLEPYEDNRGLGIW